MWARTKTPTTSIRLHELILLSISFLGLAGAYIKYMHGATDRNYRELVSKIEGVEERALDRADLHEFLQPIRADIADIQRRLESSAETK